MVKMDFETLRDSLFLLFDLEDQYAKLILFNPRSSSFEEDTVIGWIEVYSEILREAQKRCIFAAVCRHCRPRGFYGNLMRFARNFSDEVVKEIQPTDLFYEIDSFYTKSHCPYVVEFKL